MAQGMTAATVFSVRGVEEEALWSSTRNRRFKQAIRVASYIVI
jgi:hypothetical protein